MTLSWSDDRLARGYVIDLVCFTDRVLAYGVESTGESLRETARHVLNDHESSPERTRDAVEQVLDDSWSACRCSDEYRRLDLRWAFDGEGRLRARGCETSRAPKIVRGARSHFP